MRAPCLRASTAIRAVASRVQSDRWHAVQDLPEESLVFLLGSRYCETDRLSDAAWSLWTETCPSSSESSTAAWLVRPEVIEPVGVN